MNPPLKSKACKLSSLSFSMNNKQPHQPFKAVSRKQMAVMNDKGVMIIFSFLLLEKAFMVVLKNK